MIDDPDLRSSLDVARAAGIPFIQWAREQAAKIKETPQLVQQLQEHSMQEPRVISASANNIAPPPGFSGAVTPIQLKGGDGSAREFRPCEDITAKETALVMVLLFKLTLSRETVPLNWPEYITANGLDRHFVGV